MNVERWDTYEVAFHASSTYTNPFQDVEIDATFIHESGKKIAVNGFYDGDSVWRIRFMPTELGKWTYFTRSADPSLDENEGSLTCIPQMKEYLHGPLSADGYHFVHADGARRFLISTRLSCHFSSPAVWQKVVSFLKENRINRVLFMMVGIAEHLLPPDAEGSARHLYGEGPDFSMYDVRKFQQIDAFIETLRRSDIIASPYFYYFNDRVQRGLTIDQDKAYIRYGMARFGAYCNVMPVLSNEVEQEYTERTAQYDLASHDWANEIGPHLARQSVFELPVSVHNPMETQNATNPSFYTILRDWQFPWADFMLRQMQVASLSGAREISDKIPEQRQAVYNERGFARHNQLLIELRRYKIPIINEEPGYEMKRRSLEGPLQPLPWNSQTLETLIPTFWTAVTAGAYTMWGSPGTYELNDPLPAMQASHVPKTLKILHDLISGLPYWQMKPKNDAVSAAEVTIDDEPYRTNFCLAKEGETYLIFSLNGGKGKVTLTSDRVYSAIRLNPRTGERKDLGKVKGGTQNFSLPKGNWVLLYQALDS